MQRVRHAVDERGVSPVIGVILMVAITVILAATAASFFLGIGQQGTANRAPTAAFDAEFDVEGGSHVLTVAHRGGDTVARETLRVVVSGAECANGADPNKRYAPGGLGYGGSDVAAGSLLELNAFYLCGSTTTDLDLSRATVTVTWVDRQASSSNTLWRWRGPSA